MKQIKIALFTLLAGTVALWLMAEPSGLFATSFMPWRAAYMQFSGVLAIVAMSAAMILAARSRWLENTLNGLDKAYRLHKWVGIVALVASIGHWAGKESPGWLSALGLLTLGPRPQPPSGASAASAASLESLFRSMHGAAEMLGQFGFYIAVILLVIALVKLVPYHLFYKTHRWIGILYLALVFHSVILLNFEDWLTPLGIALLAVLAWGSVAALQSIFGLIGVRRKSTGRITFLRHFPALRVMQTMVQLDEKWPGHAPGQFAFVTGPGAPAAHPFTIASAWTEDRNLTFITKALGDDTATLHQTWKSGDTLQIEGPYGRFTFDDGKDQIWVGGGIGVTPFIGRMQAMAAQGAKQRVDFFHTTVEEDSEALRLLRADAAAAGVNLHILVEAKDGRLSGARIREAVPHWQATSMWFCGPAGFGDALRHDFLGIGMQRTDFHQELFEMR